MMVCSVAAASAQTLVTSLSQLRVGSVVKIYPKASNGTSQYEDSNMAMTCGGDKQTLTSYKQAGAGDSWTIADAGDNYVYLKNDVGVYWAYQGKNTSPMTCTVDESSAVRVGLTWDTTYSGICFWNELDGTGLNNLYGYNNM